MSDFDALVAEYTLRGSPKVHGVLFKCVDSKGNEILSKVAGYDSLSADAAPLREDAVFKVASATKLMTSIALLQCVEQGLVGLDQPLTGILPELAGKAVLQATPQGQLASRPSRRPITARHLLSHTSGLGYPFTHPLLARWRQTPEGRVHADARLVPDRYDSPLLFEPGEGWLYGSSLDWAGVVVRRLHGGASLEDYMTDHIWRPLGLRAPFPTFNISARPDYHARLMGGAERTPAGLRPWEFPMGDNPVDQEGGSGLAMTAQDFVAVLGDLVAEAPRLLRPETVALMFTPQVEEGSAAKAMLLQLRPAWEAVAGPAAADAAVNHGLGGLLLTGPVPAIGQPGGVLAWGGATNPVWFASRELGVAGFFGTQLSPFGDPACRALVNAWKQMIFERLGVAAAGAAR